MDDDLLKQDDGDFEEQVDDSPKSQWMTFMLNGEVYGLDVMVVREVLSITEIAPVPGSPDSVLGIINLRGNVVTVVDARAIFGIGKTQDRSGMRIIVIESGETVIGLLVDSVDEVRSVSDEMIGTAPTVASTNIASTYIKGVVTQDKEMLILIDAQRIIDADLV